MGGLKEFSLPRAPLQFELRGAEIHVFDILRRRWLPATPEEIVRQSLVHFMIHHCGYPQGLISCEWPIKQGLKKFRADVVVLSRKGKPWLVVECKAPQVPLDQKTLHQVAAYVAGMAPEAVALCNGLTCLYFQRAFPREGWQTGLPPYPSDTHSPGPAE
ncbi:MAG: type I restriction enzyme HsdR N-terminal domain-containing protein [Flavobacteriales bacterium]|nr:type I restriction enzyme HsdR N-terminal domain-containing protein [Flavobacteriales bacterium]MCX7768700.1 type I restriction enzyme HsdR N-terminal domain-containing protein [Flavobacteriales bacterium]MDW8410101.1 type I restriction enzyme HsdR N-terminal domain-containing protein [Flavobacteriales bacterium]